MTQKWGEAKLGALIREEREPVGSIDGDGLPVLGVTNIHGVTATGIEASEDRSKYLRLRPRRFVYNPYRVNVGSLGLSSDQQNGIVSPAYVVFAPNEAVDAKFLYFYLKSARGSQLINFYGNRGTVRSALRFQDLCEINIPLPPIAVQRHLVAWVEVVAGEIQTAGRLRYEAIQEVEALRSAKVSQLFAEGPARGWTPGNLGDLLVDDCYGTSEKTSNDDSGTPILRMGNIQDGRLDLSDLKYLHLSDRDRNRLLLESGDILVNRTNSAELVGKCAVFDLLGEYSFASYLIRLRLDQNRADPRLVAAYINSPLGRAYMLAEKRQMTGRLT